MRLTRVHVDASLAGQTSIRIEGDAANHITRVLRLRQGDALTLFDGRGGEYAARVAGMERGAVRVEIGEFRPLERESSLGLTLVQGVARGERMDLVVQKATELGVTRIVPVLSERSVVRLTADRPARKTAHWRAVAIAACEQCGRNRLPAIDEPQTLAQALGRLVVNGPRLLLDPGANRPVTAHVAGAREVALLVGPEGGFTAAEIEHATRVGFEAGRLGPRILRTETAALACVALIQAVAGDLGR